MMVGLHNDEALVIAESNYQVAIDEPVEAIFLTLLEVVH